jgi:hypothetical protein
MIAALGSIVVMAGLFVAFAWIQHRPGCSGSCGSCTVGTCELEETDSADRR